MVGGSSSLSRSSKDREAGHSADLSFCVDFSKEGPEKSTKKSPVKFIWKVVRKNFPRISAEGFSQQRQKHININLLGR